jgi:hypothetical protein
VEVLGFEDLGLPVGDPCGAGQGLTPGTLAIATGVVPDACVATLVALFDVAAKRGGPAPLTGGQDAALGRRERGTRLRIDYGAPAAQVQMERIVEPDRVRPTPVPQRGFQACAPLTNWLTRRQA